MGVTCAIQSSQPSVPAARVSSSAARGSASEMSVNTSPEQIIITWKYQLSGKNAWK